MATHRFLVFQLVFWLTSGFLLFLYGLSYGHWHIAMVRNIYVPIMGLLSSYFLVFMFNKYQLYDLQADFLKILLLSSATACLLAWVVNPITYAMLGYQLTKLPWIAYFQDLLYFCLFYVLWSILYILYFLEHSSTDENTENDYVNTIMVEQNKQLYQLKTSAIMLIRASGDYVELVTETNSYLKNGTLTSWENSLDPIFFQRISRSLIVNLTQIVSVKPQPRGVFRLQMQNNEIVQSSRSYKQKVLETIPPPE